MEALPLYLALAIGINVAMFVPAFLFKTDRLTDISYALTFMVLAGLAFQNSSITNAHFVLLVAVSVWALRLGSFLLIRIWKTKRDKRFDDKRNSFVKFLAFWLLQGFSVFVILIPSLLVFENQNARIADLSYFGLAIFIIGLLLESTADIEKYRFNSNPRNKGKWIATGVWRYSRHPNYLGEMLVWIGIYIFAVPMLPINAVLLGLISPLYIITLLLFISGIPLLEKSADARWGKDKNYQEYKRKTPVLVPKIFL